jgi:hypothetical protein
MVAAYIWENCKEQTSLVQQAFLEKIILNVFEVLERTCLIHSIDRTDSKTNHLHE